MSKIICDVCGTVYPDSAECCPICGYVQSEFLIHDQEDFLADSPVSQRRKDDSFQDDTIEYEEEVYSDAPQDISEYDDNDFEDDFEEEEAHRGSVQPSTIVIVVLVVIITLLLLAIGVLFFGFYLPNRADSQPPVNEIQTEAVTESTVEETTEPTIPCTSLVLTSGVTELTKEGQYWLLHVTVLPEDTTDTLVFVSEDESVVTVNEHGRLTAIGEGETIVHISCGDKLIQCKVSVHFEEEEETEPTTEPHTPNSVEHETLPEGLADVTEPVYIAEETEATEAAETTEDKSSGEEIVLKLEKFDVSSTTKGVSFELKLACDLKPEDVEWYTMDSNVAIVKNGVVTTIGSGKTTIVAQYQGQKAECIVRCNF